MVYLCYLTSHQSDYQLNQLYTATLDNTGSNNMTCKTIQDIHARRGLPLWNSGEQQLPYVYSFFTNFSF